MKRALITGITGQDGSHLADLLLSKDYEVHGIVRRRSSMHLVDDLRATLRGRGWTFDQICARLHFHPGDVTDPASVDLIVRNVRPDEIYNLAAMSFVGASWDTPGVSLDSIVYGLLHILEAARKYTTRARIYQASSSEMYGSTPAPQREDTPFHPRSPYAVAKASAHYLGQCYRESHGMHISMGILFNHEGPNRGPEFVTRKITLGAARICRGRQRKLELGNLDAQRDWGHARDYVEAMYLMLQQELPDDYVIATGETHTVREFVEKVFSWHGLDWEKYVEIDPKFYRPAEVNVLCGDASKARERLDWIPSVTFAKLAEIMAAADDALVARQEHT